MQNEFEARTGGVWPLNVRQVYSSLQRLERDGLVDGEGERQKRYRITADPGCLSSAPFQLLALAIVEVPLAAACAEWLIASRGPPAIARR